MFCCNCGSKNVKEHVQARGEVEEVPGVQISEFFILCLDCNWGFAVSGTKDMRKLKSPKTAV